MFNIIEKFINKMSIDDVNNFALSKNIHLSNDELIWTYNFIKKNYKNYFSNPKAFNIDLYKNNYSKENFNKIVKVFNEYSQKYSNYL